jgi:hypothetical protein
MLGSDDFGQAGTVYTSFSTPKPRLNLRPAGTNLVLAWTVPATNFIVQRRTNLFLGNWVTMTNAPVMNPTNVQNQLNLPFTNNTGYFRLMTQ